MYGLRLPDRLIFEMSEVDKSRWYRNPKTKEWVHGDPDYRCDCGLKKKLENKINMMEKELDATQRRDAEIELLQELLK